mgnify:CR=1 FL=1
MTNLDDMLNQTPTLTLEGIEPEKQEAEEVKKEIVEKIAPKAVHFDYIGPIIGASVGPGTVMLSAWGKKVDYVG